MAALQKIRSKGVLLIAAIGLALFAFIAEEFVRSISTTSGVSKQQVGQVYGEKLSIQEYQQMVEEATDIYKMRMGGNLTDDQQNQVRDQVWQEYVSFKLIEHETDKLGLIVTKDEIDNALREGTASSLMTMTPFAQGGRFDYTALQAFLKQFNEAQKSGQIDPQMLEQGEMICRMWDYAYTQLSKELLTNKFNALLMQSFISNPKTAEAVFKDRTVQHNTIIAAMPNSTIADKDVEPTDSELKEAYNKNKELFRMPFETRDIKYIDVAVTASAKDKADLNKSMADLYAKIQAGDDLAAVINSSKSQIHYVNAPLSKNAFPYDIRQQLDSMAVGSSKVPYLNAMDNTMNIVKLVSKVQAPDSVLYRVIFVQADTEEKTGARADSIVNALNSGAKFKDLAKKYGQPGDSAWVTSSQYENTNIDEEAAKYVTALNTTPGGGLANIEMQGGRVILQVLDRKAMVTKYNAAVVKCSIDFSKDTYAKALNDLNRFVAGKKTIEEIEKAAGKSGYMVRELPEFASSAHNVANIAGTKDVVKWIFDEAEPNNISRIYECGNGGHLLLVSVTGVHKKGYREWDDARVKEALKQMVMSSKKADKIMENLKGVKTIAEAKAKGAVVDSLSNVSFANTPYIAATSAPEPVISAAATTTKVGQTSGLLKGGAGVYLVQVLSEDKGTEKFNKDQEMQMISQMNLRIMGQQLLQSLMIKADVKDNRYKF